MTGESASDWLVRSGVGRGDLVGLVVTPELGVTIAAAGSSWSGPCHDLVDADANRRPRWVIWSTETTDTLAAHGVRLTTAWDLAAVHRLLWGTWRVDPGRVWAAAHGIEGAPASTELDLFSLSSDGPTTSDGHLHGWWVSGGWATEPDGPATWARAALECAQRQADQLAGLEQPSRALANARVESTTSLLCSELATDGLPLDRSIAESILIPATGPRPSSTADLAATRAHRDAAVLAHVPDAGQIDLRSPGQVKALLRRVGIEVPDTRAWRLETMRDAHPLVDALLVWRKAERLSTTYGYAWLDEHVGPDGRLRGQWSSSDGAAGRMTATAGLHNLPSELRPAVVAGPGHRFVRADLGQIEPRVLAAVSGDQRLVAATVDDDLYAPVARELGVDRATAKLAVLGAMYGQTTGMGAQALRRMDVTYPVAMAYLTDAAAAAQAGRSLRTYGGRLVRMGTDDANEYSDAELRSRAAARGRYGRNALVQGAAAELFKMWAVTVRARVSDLGARIVLCLHDELLVHTPSPVADEVAAMVDACLAEASARWCPGSAVRFVSDTAVVERWSDAKA